MITRAQQILVKRAQREAGLNDEEYRQALEVVSGCHSSTDAAMTDRHIDLVLAYFEAIYWRRVDKGELQAPCKPNAVFRQRGYWGRKNPRQQTSRDRYATDTVSREISELENALAELGFNADYCAAIRRAVSHGRGGASAQFWYKVALKRTLKAKQNALSKVAVVAGSERDSDNEPF